jgi:hypothetical protein
MMKQASQWTSSDDGRPMRTTMTRASGRRKDPDDGLRCHMSLIRRSDFTPPPPHSRWDRAKATTFSPPPTTDEVDRLYRQLMEIHAISAA